MGRLQYVHTNYVEIKIEKFDVKLLIFYLSNDIDTIFVIFSQ